MKGLLIILLGGLLIAALIGPTLFEVADTAVIDAGGGFNGDPPPCRPDRVGVTLTLKGAPYVCQETQAGYQWTPAGRAASSGEPALNTPCTPDQHGKLSRGGTRICMNTFTPGEGWQLRWRPWPEPGAKP